MPTATALPTAIAYKPRREPRHSTLMVNRLHYNVREWGEPGQPMLIMLHGWMDVSASFQFLVDALADDWHVVAPDWRGFGLTEATGASSYWMPEYLADLEALIDIFGKGQAVRLIGHSMGGNIGCLYAGVRPQRIRAFVNLEGLGLPGDGPEAAPGKLARWLDEIHKPPTLRDYSSIAEVVQRLQKTNPRLSYERARFLALHWSRETSAGRFELRADPAHKISSPQPYHAAVVTAIWANITAPVLWVMARESNYAKKMDALPDYPERLAVIRACERVWIEAASHMLHHDQPEALAAVIEGFLERSGHGFSSQAVKP